MLARATFHRPVGFPRVIYIYWTFTSVRARPISRSQRHKRSHFPTYVLVNPLLARVEYSWHRSSRPRPKIILNTMRKATQRALKHRSPCSRLAFELDTTIQPPPPLNFPSSLFAYIGWMHARFCHTRAKETCNSIAFHTLPILPLLIFIIYSSWKRGDAENKNVFILGQDVYSFMQTFNLHGTN